MDALTILGHFCSWFIGVVSNVSLSHYQGICFRQRCQTFSSFWCTNCCPLPFSVKAHYQSYLCVFLLGYVHVRYTTIVDNIYVYVLVCYRLLSDLLKHTMDVYFPHEVLKVFTFEKTHSLLLPCAEISISATQLSFFRGWSPSYVQCLRFPLSMLFFNEFFASFGLTLLPYMVKKAVNIPSVDLLDLVKLVSRSTAILRALSSIARCACRCVARHSRLYLAFWSYLPALFAVEKALYYFDKQLIDWILILLWEEE